MKDDINSAQSLMDSFFPEMKKHKEPMAFSLSGNESRTKFIISILIRPSIDGVEEFQNSCGTYDITIRCYIINENGVKKLGFRMEFLFGDRIFGLDGIINPGDPIQNQIIKVLRINKELFIWVADEDGCVVRLIQVEWDYDSNKMVLDELLTYE